MEIGARELQTRTHPSTPHRKKLAIILGFREIGIFIALLLLGLGFALTIPNFGTIDNLSVVIRQFSFIAIVALGQTLVLITGGIDLSVGSVGGLTGILSAWLMVNTTVNPWICICLGMLAGMLCGLVNAVLVTKIGLNPFVVTLGTMQIFSGLIMVITQGWAIVRLPECVFVLGRGSFIGIPMPIVIMVIISFILDIVLRHSVFGRHLYATGGNEEAARLVGIRTDLIKGMAYILSGLLASVAGVVMVARLTSGQPTVGDSWVLPSVAAAVIGGTALSGGEGTVFGTLLGAALMGVLSNAIVLAGVSPYWQNVIIGTALLLAVILDILRKKLGSRV